MAAYLEVSVHLRDTDDSRKSIEILDLKVQSLALSELITLVGTDINPELNKVSAFQLQETYFPTKEEPK